MVTSTMDVKKIKRAINIFHGQGDPVELRIIENNGKITSRYYDDFDKFSRDAASRSGIAAGVYCVLNQIDTALLARSANHLTIGLKNLTQDNNIINRNWLPIDIDAVRPAGISSTDTEHDYAIKKAYEIRDYLISIGFLPDSIIIGDSGNGGYVLVSINLPNDAGSTKLIKSCLEAIAAKFDDKQIQIDQTVYNASHILKVPGTMARKGDSMAEEDSDDTKEED